MINRKYKPIPIREAEEMVKQLIQKRYGKGRNHMKNFHSAFVGEFPQFANYNYDYFLQLLRPSHPDHNPDLLESVFRFFEKTYLVEGSIASSRI